MSSVEQIYDGMAESYNSHKTSSYFSHLQDIPIAHSLIERFGNDRRDLDTLVVGVGDVKTHLKQLSHELDPFSVPLTNITLLDISARMLEKYNHRFGKPVKRIKGDANTLNYYFENSSFDVILAALCDHIEDQKGFYRQCHELLKPKGLLITTYPHPELMRTIRKDIYGIEEDQTKFLVDDSEYLVPSSLYSATELKDLFETNGFVNVGIQEIDGNSGAASLTVQQACLLMGKEPSQTKTIMMGVGNKT